MSIGLKDLPLTAYCHECNTASPRAAWTEDEYGVWCETCDWHYALVCPACGERYDTVYTDAEIFVPPATWKDDQRLLVGEHDPAFRWYLKTTEVLVDGRGSSRLCYR